MLETYDCSPEAKEKIKTTEDKVGLKPKGKSWAKYPWDSMAIGKCFVLPFEAGKDKSLRTLASQQKTKLGKEFIVIKHKELKIFEVARIA